MSVTVPISSLVDTTAHPIEDGDYAATCAGTLDATGALVLTGFAKAEVIEEVVAESAPREAEAFYAGSTHNVYLTDPDPALDPSHPFNRQVVSSKGLIADDQIPDASSLRAIYDSGAFRTFLCRVLGIDAIHPYADELSSINVHFAAEGMELGWHFDNSSFAVTMLLQAAEGGAHFDFVPSVRDSERPEVEFERVGAVLDHHIDADVGPEARPDVSAGADTNADESVSIQRLRFRPGDLVLFRGRDALHRVTPTEGETTRMLVVFAYNSEPGVALSPSARSTFYGR